MYRKYLKVIGAREHNLKNITVTIPKDSLVVITGVSGSGKSSLAFDTIYTEGQRRYLESLSSYVRQFLGMKNKPDVDQIEGLSPTISIEQKGISHNPRSTVGTVTEIYDYLRLLFARAGTPYCHVCGSEVRRRTLDEIVEHILENYKGERIEVLAPIIRGKKGEHKNVLIKAQKEGFLRVRVDKVVYWLEEEIPIDKNKRHDIEIVVDRLRVKDDKDVVQRLSEAVETALNLSEGWVLIVTPKGEEIFSELFVCPVCGASLPEIEPRLFSFNSPYGACKRCGGLGFSSFFDEDLVVNYDISIKEGAILPWTEGRFRYKLFELLDVAKQMNIDVDVPFGKLSDEDRYFVLYGDGDYGYSYTRYGVKKYKGFFEGVMNWLERKYEETESETVRQELEKYRKEVACPECKGSRLRKEALAIKVNGKNIYELSEMPIVNLYDFIKSLKLTERQMQILKQVLKEVESRLKFIIDVGVGYLTLSRRISTLSGGEAQRIRLATQIGSRLSGVIYVLDEPTIGLHPRDTNRLIKTLKELKDLGNTVIVVEHDRDTIKEADFVVELGPGAGKDGGYIVVADTKKEVLKHKKGLTGPYIAGDVKVITSVKRRKPSGWIKVKGAKQFNLKNIDVDVPLGVFACITGVSGSGKSTLMYEILYKGIRSKIDKHFKGVPGKCDAIEGVEQIKRVVMVDQTPIGRTPRSNPATYTGVFTPIRELFASLPESKLRGYKPGRFSFNVKGGRCEACQGEGLQRISMQFLPDVYIVCDVCKGTRYNRETLEVKYKGLSIADVLNLTVDEALKLFENIPIIRRKLKTLSDAGLGYIKLGQPAPTLSGGEAQRIKLASELNKKFAKNVLYMLDEPTVGLHYLDVQKLLNILNKLVDQGNSVIVIEHNLDVIVNADYIIDLGPEGGEKGGQLVACGMPEEVACCDDSYTGSFIKKLLRDNMVYDKM